MNKASNKLAASIRKIKNKDEKPEAAQPSQRDIETHGAAAATKPSPTPIHPERVWPD